MGSESASLSSQPEALNLSPKQNVDTSSQATGGEKIGAEVPMANAPEAKSQVAPVVTAFVSAMSDTTNLIV